VKSNLTTYVNYTNNHSGQRTQTVTKITPHHWAGVVTAKAGCDYFASTDRQASSNYVIGNDGSIGQSVPEEYRAWTSASEWNDNRAITIEVSDKNTNWEISDAAYNALVNLSADICKRYGIDPHYDGTQNGTITMHKMFASTSCPEWWLSEKIESGQFESDVKAAMNPFTPVKIEKAADNSLYRCYNSNNGDHIFTKDLDEAQNLIDHGWTYEDIAWVSPESGDDVYRVTNPNTGTHHFCLEKEKDVLKGIGYKVDGIAFQSSGDRPVYRLYNKNDGSHMLTASEEEKTFLISAGWTDEGSEIRY
jgi:hypothetical protein